MTSRADLTVHVEVEQLYHRYAYAVDQLDTEVLADCYDEQASFHCSLGDAGTQRGRDAIVARQVFRHERERFRETHLITNVVVLEVDEPRAQTYAAAAIFSTRAGETCFETTGHYEDELHRGEDGLWRFTRRSFVTDRSAPAVVPPQRTPAAPAQTNRRG